MGNTIAGITFRIGAGIDSIGQVCSMSDQSVLLLLQGRSPSATLEVPVNKKEGAAVHIETTDVQSGDYAIVVGWERGGY